MKETVEHLIQNLKNNSNHPLFKEQFMIITRDEFKFRKGLIKAKLSKIKRSISNQLTRWFGSILSFIFAILWFVFVLPLELIDVLIMLVKIPFQCREHKKLLKMVENHPDFIKLQSKIFEK